MFWADRIANEITKTQHVDDMFTPSGYAHIGSLRGPVLHDIVSRVLSEKDKKTEFTFVFNDFDPIDGLPGEFEKKFTPYLGFPLRLAPSPVAGFASFGDYFAADFKTIQKELGVNAKYLSSWDMYHEGKFNDVVKIALDNGEKIQDVYQKISGSSKKSQGWYPFQVICPKCQKLGTTKVTGWDGKEVHFRCEPSMVKWAAGCGYEGDLSPFDGNGKLPWKVDWAAHWKVMGVTFEGAGKDHASKGGSYDIAFELCKEVFHYPKPHYFPYEFFLLGGKKMSSSKGLGLKARDLTSILPPELARFLIMRTPPQKAIEFAPDGFTIPDLFDEFDRCASCFFDNTDEDLKRIFELSQVNDFYKEKIFLPRFRDIANFIQMPSIDLEEKIAEIKGSKLTQNDLIILHSRKKYAEIWLKKYAPENFKFAVLQKIPKGVELTEKQKEYLCVIAEILSKTVTPEEFQNQMYELTKKIGIPPIDAFACIYQTLIGKNHGPKAAWFILSLNRDFVITRFKEMGKK